MNSPAGWTTISLRLLAAVGMAGALSLAPLSPLSSIGASLAFGRPARALPPAAEAIDPATLLPADLWLAVEARGLGAWARTLPEGSLRRRLTENAVWKRFTKTPEYVQLLAGLGFVELTSGMKTHELLGALLGEQLVAGIVPDGDKPGLVAVDRTLDSDTAEQLLQVARGLLQMSKEEPKPGRFTEVDGHAVLVLRDQLWVGVCGRDLLAASSERLLQALFGRALAGGGGEVAPLLARSRAEASQDALLHAAVDSKKIAATRPGGILLPDQLDNMGGAMLVGDLVALLARADTVCAQVRAAGDALSVDLAIPTSATAPLPDHYRSFAHASAQQPLRVLAPSGTLLTASLRRDWATFWADHGELCVPAAEKEFADLKTNLAIFFGGKSLPDDILPQMTDELLFVITRQTFPGVPEPPAVRYPAFAFVWQTRGDPRKLGREFESGMQLLIAVTNGDRAMKNQTPLELFIDQVDGVKVCGGRCPTDDDRPADPLRFNFSPCAAWFGDRIVIASTEELMHQLIQELRGAAGATPNQPEPPNPAAAAHVAGPGVLSLLRVEGAASALLGREDREALIANTMITKGKTREEAELENDALLALAEEIASATLQTRLAGNAMHVELELALRPLPPATAATPAHASEGSR